jgi:integrase
MPIRKLTALAIPTLAPGEWHDAVLPGLSLRVGKRRRSWSFRYHAGGSYHRKPLGHFPVVELGEAREVARHLIGRLDSGAPPSEPAPHPRSTDALTLGGLLDRYEAVRVREGKRLKTFPKGMRLLRRNLKPYLGLPADQFSKSDLRKVRDSLIDAGTPVAANRMLGTIGPALQWASEEDLISVNFVSAIRRSPEQARSRVLTKTEIKKIWAALDRFNTPVARSYARMLQFLLLTAQRLDDAASLKYGDILDGTWRQIANKSDRPQSLKLPPLALKLVGKGDPRSYVFAGLVGKIGGRAKWKRILDETSGVTGWVVHDLRRSAASHMQDLAVRHDVIEAVLNHAMPGVAGVYLRSELTALKAEALATWAREVGRIIGPLRLSA